MAGVLKQAVHAPLLELGSSVVAWVHIPVLDIEPEEAVEPTLALSRIGSDDSTPRFHGLSTCFQNHTTYQFVGGALYGCGFCLGRHCDVGWSPPHTSHLIGFGGGLKTWFILFMISSTMALVSFCLFLFVSPLELAVLWPSVPDIGLSFP